jgi:EAL domain-containing protein (putative c-di-GMP-specific phosphodiesterase class I)
VETQRVEDWLRRAGCDVVQGYHLARPARWQELLPALLSDSDQPNVRRAA